MAKTLTEHLKDSGLDGFMNEAIVTDALLSYHNVKKRRNSAIKKTEAAHFTNYLFEVSLETTMARGYDLSSAPGREGYLRDLEHCTSNGFLSELMGLGRSFPFIKSEVDWERKLAYILVRQE